MNRSSFIVESLREGASMPKAEWQRYNVAPSMCIEAAERITTLENILRHMTGLARSYAAKTGPMHAWWDSIMDAQAVLKNQPTLHDWRKS